MDLLENQTGGDASPLPNGAAERLSAASAKVQSKRGGARPGAGRKKSNGPVGSASAPVEEEAPIVASQADIEFVSETAKSVFVVLDGVVTRKLYNSVRSLDPKLEETADKLAQQAQLTPEEIELIGKTFAALAAKYGGLARWAPEMALAGILASYGMRVTNSFGEAKKLIVAVTAMKGPGNAGSPPPDQNPDRR